MREILQSQCKAFTVTIADDVLKFFNVVGLAVGSESHHLVFVLQRDHSQVPRDQRIQPADRIVLAHFGDAG